MKISVQSKPLTLDSDDRRIVPFASWGPQSVDCLTHLELKFDIIRSMVNDNQWRGFGKLARELES